MKNQTTMIAAATWATAAVKAPQASFAASVAERAIPGSVTWTPPTC